MPGDRAARAELEAAQSDLKAARLALEQPLDTAAVRTEVGHAIDRLAQEAHALAPQLENARAELEEARAYLARTRQARNPSRPPRAWQRVLMLFFLCLAILAGPLLDLAGAQAPVWVSAAMFCFAVALGGWELGLMARHRRRR